MPGGIGGGIGGGIAGIGGGIGNGLGGRRGAGDGAMNVDKGAGGVSSFNSGNQTITGSVADLAKDAQRNKGDLYESRDKLNGYLLSQPTAGAASLKQFRGPPITSVPIASGERRANLEEAKQALAAHRLERVQEGKLGVELSLEAEGLRNQSRLTATAVKTVAGRNCVEFAGVWIDEDFDAKTPLVTVKAQSDAYFRLLERQPQLREVLKLGNAIVWITPSGTALVIDPNGGKEKLEDAEIDGLFKAKK